MSEVSVLAEPRFSHHPVAWVRRSARVVGFFFSIVAQTALLAWKARSLPVSERPEFRARWQQQACVQFLRVLGVRVRVVGEMPSADGAYLVVPNHLGILDPWVLGSTMPVAFVAKSEMSSWPIMGWVGRTVGMVFVARDRRMETNRFVDEVRDRMRHGIRVLVFPEGTTSDGLDLLPFKTGAFEAVAGMDDGAVLPVYHNVVRLGGVEADAEMRRRYSWSLPTSMVKHVGVALSQPLMEIEVRVGVPISTAGRDRKELAVAAEEAMRELAGGLVRG